MASIVLILSHPLIGYRKETVRTHLVGQSRNLWKVSGHGMGIFTLRGFGSGAAGGSSTASPGRNRLDLWLGRSRGSVDIWERNKELIRKRMDIGEHFSREVIQSIVFIFLPLGERVHLTNRVYYY